MPFSRFPAYAAAMLLAYAGGAHAATLTVDMPGCANVTVTGAGPNYTITCAQPQQTCAVNATPAAPQGNTTANLTVACTPAATSVTWQASRDCIVPSVNAQNPLAATVTEPGGRSCVYTATSTGGGSGQTTVVWQGAGTTPPPPPPNAPTGCSITRTPSNGSLGASGGAIAMSAACTGGGAVTSWSWRKNAQNGWSTAQGPSDTLPANTGSAQVTYTYGVTACAGSACASEVTTTFTVAGAAAVGFCGQYQDVVIIDFPMSGTIDTAQYGGFQQNGVVVGRMAIPSTATGTGIGQVRFVEYVDGPAERLMTVSTQPCDFRGFNPGSVSATDSTGSTAPLKWGNGQTPAINYQLTASIFNPQLVPGQTYYFNVRNINWVSGQPSCNPPAGTTCNGRFQMASP